MGSQAAVVFAEVGYEVVLYDNLSNSKRSLLVRLKPTKTLFTSDASYLIRLVSSPVKFGKIKAV